MTLKRDPDQLVVSFLQEGPADLSPHLVEAIRVDVGRHRQRRPWGARRAPQVSRFTLLLAPAALLIFMAVAVVVGGSQPRDPGIAGPTSDGSVTVPATPTPTPTTTAVGPGEAWYAYTTTDGVAVLIRADGTGDHPLLPERDIAQGLPDWSPDGSQLVLERDYGPTSQLWLVNADGTNGRALTPRDDRCVGNCMYTGEPAFSPDGRSIAFVRVVVDVSRVLSSSLVVLDVASGAERTLATSTVTDAYGSPTWSPDGTRIAIEVRRFRSLGSSTSVAAELAYLAMVDLTAASPAPEPIPGTDSGDSPDWRPTGNELVFVRNPWFARQPWKAGRSSDPWDLTQLEPGEPTQIVVLQLDGLPAERVDIEADGAPLIRPAWTPDGLAYTYGRAEAADQQPLVRERTEQGVDRPITDVALVTGIGARLRPLP